MSVSMAPTYDDDNKDLKKKKDVIKRLTETLFSLQFCKYFKAEKSRKTGKLTAICLKNN